MARPHHRTTPPPKPEEGFWDTGLGLTLIVIAICIACVPIYIGMNALGAFTFTGLLVIFGGFWAFVFIAAGLVTLFERKKPGGGAKD